MKIPQEVIYQGMEKWLVPFDLYHMLEDDPEECKEVLGDWFDNQPNCSFCDHFYESPICGNCPLYDTDAGDCHRTYVLLDKHLFDVYDHIIVKEALFQILIDIERAND